MTAQTDSTANPGRGAALMRRVGAWVAGQFTTRVIVLMPIAIAINIVLGQTVSSATKLPIYLDSIGTILVGALAGPIPGALTGLISNLAWTFVVPPPFQSPYAAPYSPVAVEIGLLAGVFSYFGFFRSRPHRPLSQLLGGGVVAIAIVFALVAYTYSHAYTNGQFVFFGDTKNVSPLFVGLAWGIAVMLVLAAAGFLALLVVRRDLGVAFITVGGVISGIISALISAPIYAAQGGVSGSGTDVLVAVFQQAGANLRDAVLQQGLLSDPVDKLITYFVVFLILRALSRRFVARFPQGERAVGIEED